MKKTILLRSFIAACAFATTLLPIGVAAAPGDLYVAAGDILKFAPAGTLTTFGSTPNGPIGIAFDGKGNVFVNELGAGTASIFKFTAGGTRTTVATGSGSTGFSSPRGMVVDALGNLFVADSLAGTILKFTPSGTRTTFTSGLSAPQGIAFDDAGRLYVANNGDGTISRVTATGTKSTFVSGLTKPVGIAFDSAGNLFVGEESSGAIMKVTPAGAKSVFASGVGTPVGLAFDSAGNLFVASQQPSRSILVFTPAGVRTTFVSVVAPPLYIAFEPVLHQLLNISTRAVVQTGDNALIAGFIVGGNGQVDGRVVIRALGPSLAAFGVSGALQDTTLELRNAAGSQIAFSDDWKAGGQQAEITATGLQPGNDRESALVALLPAGNYTAVVRGYNNTTGVGLVEVYNLQ